MLTCLKSGYSNVVYHTYTIQRSAQPGHNESEDRAQEDLLHAETILRKLQHFVHADRARRILWVFQDVSRSKLSQDFPDQETSDRLGLCILTVVSQGSFKATELSQFVPRPTIATSTSINSQSAPVAALRALQAANLKAFIHNTNSAQLQEQSSQGLDVRAAYSSFVSAIHGAVSYKLVKEHGFLPLGSNTFIQRTRVSENVCTLASLDIFLSTSGTIIFSTRRIALNGISTSWISDHPKTLSIGQTIRLAPTGILAVIEAESFDAKVDDAVAKLWKCFVDMWLENQGIDLDDLDRSRRYVRVRPLRATNHSTAPASTAPSVDIPFWWPVCLCFVSPNLPANRPDGDADSAFSLIDFANEFHWFASPGEDGFVDSLHFIEDWLRRKAERDTSLQDFKRKRNDAETKQKHFENQNGGSSPLNARSTAYSDLQTLAVVYPTPPDGLVTQAGGLSDNLVTSGPTDTHAASFDVQGDFLDPMDLDLGFNNIQRETSGQSSIHLEPSTMNDDLFDYMDEDEVGDNDITDADFSFFDEPDTAEPLAPGDEAMSDAEHKPSQTTLLHSDDLIETDVPLPIAEIQAMLPADPAPATESTVDVKKEEVNQDLSKPGEEAAPVAELETLRPLTPAALRQWMVDRSSKKSKNVNRRHSDFEPIAFRDAVFHSDSNYRQDGIFGYQKAMTATSRPRPTDLSLSASATKSRPSPFANGVSTSSSGSVDTDDSDDDSSVDEMPLDDDPSKRKLVSYDPTFPEAKIATPGSFSLSSMALGLQEDMTDRLPDISREDLFATLVSLFQSAIAINPLDTGGPRDSLVPSIAKDYNGPLSPLSASSPSSPASTMPHSSALKTTDKDYIQVAQMVGDQIISSCLDLLGESQEPFDMECDAEGQEKSSDATLDQLRTVLHEGFGATLEIELLKYATLQDAALEPSQLAKNQPKPSLLRRNTGSGPIDNLTPSGTFLTTLILIRN